MKSLSFLWDMDGTLVDSYPAIVPNVIDALRAIRVHDRRRYGVLQRDRDLRGELRQSLDTPHTASIKTRFQELNDTRIEKIRFMPNVRETLSLMQEAGHRHLCTPIAVPPAGRSWSSAACCRILPRS